jgi:hypothetical protein
MTTATTITAAFAAHQDRLADEAIKSLRGTLERAKDLHGPRLRSVYGCPRFGQIWSATLSSLCVLEGATFSIFGAVGGEYKLVEERAAAWAAAWAKAEVEAAAAKLIAKVGDLKHVKIVGAPERGSFILVGHHPNYAPVRVEQSRVLNVSSKGKLFNQWPARIYVDNKPVSEAAFKQISPRPEDRVLPEISL